MNVIEMRMNKGNLPSCRSRNNGSAEVGKYMTISLCSSGGGFTKEGEPRVPSLPSGSFLHHRLISQPSLVAPPVAPPFIFLSFRLCHAIDQLFATASLANSFFLPPPFAIVTGTLVAHPLSIAPSAFPVSCPSSYLALYLYLIFLTVAISSSCLSVDPLFAIVLLLFLRYHADVRLVLHHWCLHSSNLLTPISSSCRPVLVAPIPSLFS